jgi:hypothetical protein
MMPVRLPPGGMLESAELALSGTMQDWFALCVGSDVILTSFENV